MKKKVIALLMTAGLMGTMLAGCGNTSGDGRESKSDAVSTAQSNSSEKEETKEESKEKEPVEKTVVNIWSATFDQENEISAFMDAWSQTEGSKTIDVTFEEIPAGTNAERADALLTNLIGDGDIDIFDANIAEYFNFAAKGMFENLEPYAAADGYDFDQMGANNVELSRVNGNLYAFPYVQSVWLLYYNKDLFDAAGLPYPTDDMTWDEFRETAKALTKGEGADKQWGFTMPDWVCTWSGIATQTGIPFVNEDNTANLDNPAFREALQFKYDLTMVDKSGPSLAENKATQASYGKQFCAGNVGMMIAGDWVHGTIRQNLNGEFTFNYDVAAIPHPEGVEAGTTYGAPRYSGINSKRNDTQKQAAWEVLKFMASPEIAKILVQEAATLPAVVTDEVQEAYVATLPDFVENGAVIFKQHTHVEEKPYHIASSQMEQVMKEESQMFLTDSQDLDTTMDNMIRRANEEIQIVLDSLED